jgi:3-hydroxyacyl-CoA dehydrogenase/enoyl-CoA hydratase/3-hydroxybutyryl-CoA epimerase
VFASNTSTLPITGLAEASQRPANFIGIHFFSPVDKMMLVEIITGAETSQETVAKAIDYVLKIRKTPIVVNDSRGFYTSRCFSTYLTEGMEMLAEGIAPAIIDNVGRMTGMPRGPLEMHDDVALDLSYKIGQQTKKDLGDAYKASPADPIVERMVTELGRFGRKNGKGFYDYPPGRRAQAPLAGAVRAGPGPGSRDHAGDGRGAEDAPPLPPGGGGRALHGRGRGHRSARRRRRSHPRLGLRALDRRPLSLIEGVGIAQFVATCDRLASDLRTAVRGTAAVAGDGRQGRGLLRPSSTQGGRRGLN